MTDVLVKQVVDGEGDVIEANVSVWLVDTDGSQRIGWVIDTEEPLSEAYGASLTTTSATITLEPTVNVAIDAAGSATRYRFRIKTDLVTETWDVSVPDQASANLYDLVGAAGIDPADVTTWKLLTQDERNALDATTTPDADNPFLTESDDETVLNLVASGAIGGHRIVFGDGLGGVSYADSATTAHQGKVLGITTGAAADGVEIKVRVSGLLVEPSWNWAVGQVYLGANGVPTQTPPSAGFLQVIGIALQPTKLRVLVGPPLLLS